MPDSTSNENEAVEETLGEKIDRFSRRNTINVILLCLANLITAVGAIWGAIHVANGWYDSHFGDDWRREEYGRLSKLRAGYIFDKFREQLGQPSYRSSLSAGFVQNSFQRRDYWVDAVTKGDVVVAYAITSCSKDFNPIITVPGDNPMRKKVILNKSTLADMLADPFEEEKLRVGSRGTANSYVFMTFYNGNGGKYREYAVGLNDVCDWNPNDRYLHNSWSGWFWSNMKVKRKSEWDFNLPSLNKPGRVLAAKSLANTYAETMSVVLGSVHLLELYKEQIGVNRIAVR
ncbi:ETEC_3214 domain-containing protein [Streptomyces sp. NPDC021212]|uniref:ETEC_3214 domain-containing protein n=1 Tax=Streptomyces sp. NPDC021212 TaxID=3365118 RepID=UPI0037B1E8FB